MFWNKKIKELKEQIEVSNKTNNAVIADIKDELRERETDINNKLGKVENDIEKRFLEFNCEITDEIKKGQKITVDLEKKSQVDISLLFEEISKLRAEFDNYNKVIEIKNAGLINDFDKKIISFHKEISDKYFNAIENMYKFSKEISLIDSLAHKINDKDLIALKRELVKPVLEERWQQEETSKGLRTDENIKTLGQQLVQMRKQLHEEMLKKEREGKDIAELKGRISILDLVIGGK